MGQKHTKHTKHTINSEVQKSTKLKLLNLTYDSNQKVFIGDVVIYKQKLYIVRTIEADDMVGISMYTLPVINNIDSYNEELTYYTPKELILFQREDRMIAN